MSTPPPGRTSRRSGRLKPSPIDLVEELDRVAAIHIQPEGPLLLHGTSPAQQPITHCSPRSITSSFRNELLRASRAGHAGMPAPARGPPGDGPGCRHRAAGTDPGTDPPTTTRLEPQVDDPFAWRRLRGSNPRGSCPPTRFPGVCLRPLGQASAAQSSQPRHAPATSGCGRRALDGAVWPSVASAPPLAGGWRAPARRSESRAGPAAAPVACVKLRRGRL
jgi:hypothetical protein